MDELQSTGAWKPVDQPWAQGVIGSNETFRLDQPYWPEWARDSTQMQRLFVYCPDEENSIAIPGSTAKAVARFLTERYDQKDQPKPYNYNLYLITESTDGRYFQSGPIRTSDPPHHSSAPPEWLDAYGPPPL